jgi:sugar-specific transcriptional regulator TrmB/DNA-binding CsgD family transcriptional regulator
MRNDDMLLGVLGLSPDETHAYRELISQPAASAPELAPRLGKDTAETARVLSLLEQKGLAARSSGDSARFVAAPPSMALGALLVERQHEIKLAEVELSALDELYRNGATERSAADVVDVVRGEEAIRQRFLQVHLGARREVLAFVKPSASIVTASENVAEDEAVARGVTYRVVLERAVLDEPGTYEALARGVAAGEQIRVADRLPLRLVVADRELALVPADSAPERGAIGALVVHRSGLLDALLALFDAVWEQSNQLVVGADGLSESSAPKIDDVDARILGLLLAGLTDEGVAVQLSLSLRTVQRRVRRLMDLARVVTRTQLGWHAARNGWM